MTKVELSEGAKREIEKLAKAYTDKHHPRASWYVISKVRTAFVEAYMAGLQHELTENDPWCHWDELVKEIATLSDAMNFDDGDWRHADGDTLREQFDPWDVIRRVTDFVAISQRDGEE